MQMKKVLVLISVLTAAAFVSACGKNPAKESASAAAEAAATETTAAAETTAAETKQPETTAEASEEDTSEQAQSAGLANPWRDIDEEEAAKNCDRLFKAPEGAGNICWRMMGETADPSKGSYPLIELKFELDGMEFTARARQGAHEDEDISGMYYSFDVEEETTLANWGEGRMQGKVYRASGGEEAADLCTWYDIEIGIAYSLSVTAKDLDGFDIQAVAESMYNPEREPYGSIPEEMETKE